MCFKYCIISANSKQIGVRLLTTTDLYSLTASFYFKQLLKLKQND